jgi:histidinol-phosphate/aromatic aminotransferase/cobyric acid decarboxylase-like protein
MNRPPVRAEHVPLHPRFPLHNWLVHPPRCRHDLGHSGMQGELRSAPKYLRAAPPASESELARTIARHHGVGADRVFLTHGATEGNALALLALASRRPPGEPLRVRLVRPEYPPLLDAVRLLGLREVSARSPADVALLSEPNNPTGLAAGARGVAALSDGAPRVIVDETFREFTEAPPLTRSRLRGLWVTGTFTKVYGGDDVRVGYLIVPDEDIALVAEVQGILFDEVAPASIAMARNLLRHRREVLAEARDLFRRNLAALRARVPDAPPLVAPTWLDRLPEGRSGEELARAAHRAGVLVAPGSYFGAPEAVRVTLTRRSFPKALDAYLAVRRRFLAL